MKIKTTTKSLKLAYNLESVVKSVPRLLHISFSPNSLRGHLPESQGFDLRRRPSGMKGVVIQDDDDEAVQDGHRKLPPDLQGGGSGGGVH